MRKTPSPLIIRSGDIRKPINNTPSPALKKHHKSTNPALSFIKRINGIFRSFLFRRNKSRDHQLPHSNNTMDVSQITYSLDISSTDRDSEKSSRSRNSNYHEVIDPAHFTSDFTFEEIYKATGRFSPANKIGEGGFGTVYKARLKNDSFVAVKRAKRETYDQRLSAEFKNEILALSKIEHLCLVRFYGYIEHGDERLIVVEYVSNATLREHLDGTHGSGLEIGERLDIAIDVAHAITYLHTYTDPPIIHRDIKASNILLTEKLRAKVADFGFARVGVEDDPHATHISTQIKGSAGYLDPEYLRTYQLTEKSDVYSFGVLLVEMMTGRHPIVSKRSLDERVTIKWALRRLKHGEAVVAMDPRLRRSMASIQAVEKVLKLARHCLAPSRLSRPSMRKCAEILWEIRKQYRENIVKINNAASTSFLSASAVDRYGRTGRGNAFGVEESDSLMFVSA